MSSKTYSIFKLILGTIKERMKDLEMDTRSLNIRAIRFLLPENPRTKEDYVNTVKQIMYESHIIDDDTLVDTLALEDASEEQRVSRDTVTLYMRSWTLSPETLKKSSQTGQKTRQSSRRWTCG